jgi:rhodanese-related sulfurtransferase
MTDRRGPLTSVPELDRDQLRAKLDSGAPFKLVMAASDFGFRAKHIPGSVLVMPKAMSLAGLEPGDDIVVYCSNVDCIASRAVIKALLERGYRTVSHYPGGIIDWENAGLPLEGEWAGGPPGEVPEPH